MYVIHRTDAQRVEASELLSMSMTLALANVEHHTFVVGVEDEGAPSEGRWYVLAYGYDEETDEDWVLVVRDTP